jgi:AcrR family transcriptional regulator
MTDVTAGASSPAVRLPGRPRSAIADEAIREAAVELFAERGFEGLSVDEVAARAGVSKATIYRRYASKVDLVVEAASCLAALEVAFPDTGNLRADLRSFGRALIKGLKTSPAGRVMPVMISERRHYPELDEGYRRFVADRKTRTRQMLKRAINRGELPEDTDVEVMSSMLVGPVFHRFLITREPLTDAFVDALVDALLRGFGASTATS